MPCQPIPPISQVSGTGRLLEPDRVLDELEVTITRTLLIPLKDGDARPHGKLVGIECQTRVNGSRLLASDLLVIVLCSSAWFCPDGSGHTPIRSVERG